MKKIIGHILALLLSTILSIVVTLWTLGHTLGNAAHLEQQAEHVNLYSQLQTQIPGSDPELIRNQVQTLLPQFIDHLLKGSPAPVADFGSGPVSVGQIDPSILSFTGLLIPLTFDLSLAAILIALLIIAVTGRSCWTTLSGAVLVSALGVGFSVALFWIAPSIILGLLNKPDTVAIGNALAPFLNSVLHDLALQLAYAAAALIAAAILFRIIDGTSRLQARFSKMPRTSNAPKSTKPPLPGMPSS